MFAAVLDTSVLYPSLQRDFLLSLAAEGTYMPLWSEAILAELVEVETIKLTRFGVEVKDATTRAERLVGQMRAAFTGSTVTGWERLEGTFGLPDPDDEHVVAAAVLGGAGAIVTLNLRDFPVDRMPDAIDVLAPAVFLRNTVDLRPEAGASAVLTIASRSGRSGPTLTPGEILDTLDARYGLAGTAELIRPLL